MAAAPQLSRRRVRRPELRLPQTGIAADETKRSDLEESCIFEARRLVPVRRFGLPLVALIEHVERTGRSIEPGCWGVRRVTHRESEAPELHEIGGRREGQVEVDAVSGLLNQVAVEGPASARARDRELDRP